MSLHDKKTDFDKYMINVKKWVVVDTYLQKQASFHSIYTLSIKSTFLLLAFLYNIYSIFMFFWAIKSLEFFLREQKSHHFIQFVLQAIYIFHPVNVFLRVWLHQRGQLIFKGSL